MSRSVPTTPATGRREKHQPRALKTQDVTRNSLNDAMIIKESSHQESPRERNLPSSAVPSNDQLLYILRKYLISKHKRNIELKDEREELIEKQENLLAKIEELQIENKYLEKELEKKKIGEEETKNKRDNLVNYLINSIVSDGQNKEEDWATKLEKLTFSFK